METDFAAWLQAEMDKRGWKAADLAREAGLSEGTISRIRNEVRGTGRATLSAIAKALKYPDAVVFYRAGHIKNNPESITEGLDPVALDILQMLSDRTDAEKQAALAALTALFDGIDRGKSGNVGSDSGTVARTTAR